MDVSFDIEFFFTKLLPPIYTYCTKHPLAISYKKMYLHEASSVLSEKPRISHIQLAWLQAVTEFGFQSFDSIPPWDPNLVARVHTLLENFRLILASAFVNAPDKYDIKKELPPSEMDTGENVIYQIVLSTAKQLLYTVLNQEKREREVAKIHRESNLQKDIIEEGNEQENQREKPSHHCNAPTKSFYMAIERILKECPAHELTPTALWNTLLTKEKDKNYKIDSIQPCSTRSKSITFLSGHTIKYHAAREHIKKVIAWFSSSMPAH